MEESEKIEVLKEAMTWAKAFNVSGDMTWAEAFDGSVRRIEDRIAEEKDWHGFAATVIDETLPIDNQVNIDAMNVKKTWLKWHSFVRELKPILKKQCTLHIGHTSVALITDVKVQYPSTHPNVISEEPPSQLEHPMVGSAASSDIRQDEMGNVQLPGPSKGKSEKGWMTEKGGKGKKGWKGEGDGKGGKRQNG